MSKMFKTGLTIVVIFALYMGWLWVAAAVFGVANVITEQPSWIADAPSWAQATYLFGYAVWVGIYPGIIEYLSKPTLIDAVMITMLFGYIIDPQS